MKCLSFSEFPLQSVEHKRNFPSIPKFDQEQWDSNFQSHTKENMFVFMSAAMEAGC